VKTYLKFAAVSVVAAAFALPSLGQTNGADLFKAKCQMCHGADGTANTPAGRAIKAASFKSAAVIKTPDADLVAIVKNGKGKMPAYAAKLSDAQIKAAVEYIRTLQR
jgi:mono/diheme cytochrome c family protein